MTVRVAEVCPRYYPAQGGTETHVRETSERLAGRGYKVDVITTDPTGLLPRDQIVNGVRVRRFFSVAPGDAYFLSFGIRRYLETESATYDIVHAHTYQAFPALFAAQAKSNNQFVFSPNYHIKSQSLLRSMLLIPYRRFALAALDKADRIICVSEFERRIVKNVFHLNPEKLVVIPDGVNVSDYLPKLEPKDEKSVLYVGRLEEYKGVQFIIRALILLPRSIRLDIVGRGPYTASLIRLARTLGLDSRVMFHGNVGRQTLLRFYREASVYVLLSSFEAFGVSVMDALASGTPCIVANSSALSEWIDNQNCYGISLPPDIHQLASLIETVASVRIKPHYSRTWDEAVDRLGSVYDELLRGPSQS